MQRIDSKWKMVLHLQNEDAVDIVTIVTLDYDLNTEMP